MVEFNNLIADAADDDPDAYWLSVLANKLAARIPTLCKLRTFYDGREQVPTNAIPSGTDQKSFAIYKRFLELGTVNYARIITDNVSSRQKPVGFRQVSDRVSRSVEADTTWRRNRMDLKSRQVFHDVALYGSGYLLVDSLGDAAQITVLTPWNTYVGEDDEAAVYYSFDNANNVERLALFRCERDKNNIVSNVYYRSASRQADARTLFDESNGSGIYEFSNNVDAQAPEFNQGFTWETGRQSLQYATDCGYLPLVRLGSGTGMGQIEPHIPALGALDQQKFDRFCIQTMQAFRQRGIKGLKRNVYTEDDPQVKAGMARAGDPIDFSELYAMGPAALWMLPEDTEIWESQITDITQWCTASAHDVKQLAVSTGTPLDILSPDVAGSAEGASLKRESLLSKVEDLNARANDAFIRVLRMAMVASGNAQAADDEFETVWAPIAADSDLNMAQAVNYVKDVLPVKLIMRRFLHMTETEISEAMQDMADSTYQTALVSASAAASAAERTSEQTGGMVRVDDFDEGSKALVDVGGGANG